MKTILYNLKNKCTLTGRTKHQGTGTEIHINQLSYVWENQVRIKNIDCSTIRLGAGGGGDGDGSMKEYVLRVIRVNFSLCLS